MYIPNKSRNCWQFYNSFTRSQIGCITFKQKLNSISYLFSILLSSVAALCYVTLQLPKYFCFQISRNGLPQTEGTLGHESQKKKQRIAAFQQVQCYYTNDLPECYISLQTLLLSGISSSEVNWKGPLGREQRVCFSLQSQKRLKTSFQQAYSQATAS